ncbi:MAG TPA: folate-binding protein [Micromonosporaceae bacterium]|nr:folate-binding protein [Micromonosporaceae bacterium]
MSAVTAEGLNAGVPAHYGDPLREQRTLADAAGVVDRGNRGVITVTGPERLSWLHNITTQHLLELRPYQGTETLVLSPHGHVEHHAVMVDDGETLSLDTEPGAAPALLGFLERMKFFAQVELRDVSDEYTVLSCRGPDLPGIGQLDLNAPDALRPPGPKFPAGSVPARPTTVYHAAGLPGGGIARRMSGGWTDVLLPRTAVADSLGSGPRCGVWAYEALRVAARTPRLGVDTDHRTLPQEAGWLATAVHLEKGCYRGQETVARVHNLGRPPRRLVLLHLDGSSDQLPAPGADIETGGRRVGTLGTALHHFELGPIALALVKRTVPADAQLTVVGITASIDPD